MKIKFVNIYYDYIVIYIFTLVSLFQIKLVIVVVRMENMNNNPLIIPLDNEVGFMLGREETLDSKFKITSSYSLAQKLWVLLINFDCLVSN